MTRTAFRPGTWRQGVATFSGVLPVSIVLNLVLAPFLSGLLPRAAVVVVDAAILVAALNWLVLPAIQWATNGWATRPRRGGEADARSRPGSTNGLT
ncbi:hypothetical protein IT072_20340 [Leifsonia sp. ZF2019]|uniref:hypothetical protein n=1 Tax=Leifsonia sp. ZF2019 TaxID=2781978 RepID=UPI001CC09C47|nr:hypothetical protein [Leifsonia sp. ZF2019]UAJ79496.1 hypothetical protein IT072_20340 [Leifsonia sp. ZF2019]